MPGKKCYKCGETKALSEFSRDRKKRDGYDIYCKACQKNFSRRYYEENRDAIAERTRRYREENRETVRENKHRYYKKNRKKFNERSRRYREENREAMREWHRNYYEENREAIIENDRRYRKENREAVNEYRRRRRKTMSDISREVATRNGEPWTPAEDAYILGCEDTQLDMAVELGRTVDAVEYRLRILRKEIRETA